MLPTPPAPQPTRLRLRPRVVAVLGLAALAALALPLASPARAKLDSSAYKEALRKLDEGLREQMDGQIALAIRELAEDDDVRSVRIVVKVVEKRWESPEVYSALFDFVAGLTDERALREVRKETGRADPWQARVLLIDALGNARGGQEIEALAEAAEDKESKVAVAAIRQLGRLKTMASVEALIGVMKALEEDGQGDTVVWQDARNALTRVIGVKLDMGVDYENYLFSRRDKFVEGRGLPGADVPEKAGGHKEGTVTLFGEPIRCKNVAIILDRSGSMVLKDPYPPGYRPKTGTAARDAQEYDEHAWARDPARERMARAKEELKRVVQGLARVGGAKVNVVAYSTDIDFWKEEGLHKLNSGNIDELTKWVDELTAEGVTATDTALLMAFERVPDADCFYLISDGFATHDGETKVPTVDILELVREANRLRKVQINTFGFEANSGNPRDGADRELMDGLAEMTGGSYTVIP